MTPDDRTLVALEAGPRGRYWYWLEDWQTLLQSVRAQFPPDHPAATPLHYRPTGRYIDNPNPKYGQGEVWLYVPPKDAPPDPTPTLPVTDPAGPAMCVQCGNALLLRRPGRDRCARCHPVTEWWRPT